MAEMWRLQEQIAAFNRRLVASGRPQHETDMDGGSAVIAGADCCRLGN